MFQPTERIKLYILEVKSTSKGPKILVSRTHPELVKRLFESEVTEVKDGIVEIKSISREAGSRTKIAVWSNDPDVDPVGSCVGLNGARVNAIVNELRGEKIDIINWSDNAAMLIENALSPAKVISVIADAEEKTAKVVVPDYQLSLAIGKEGQNARLAARLTGFKIDIKSETQAREAGDFMDYENEYEELLEEGNEEGYEEGLTPEFEEGKSDIESQGLEDDGQSEPEGTLEEEPEYEEGLENEEGLEYEEDLENEEGLEYEEGPENEEGSENEESPEDEGELEYEESPEGEEGSEYGEEPESEEALEEEGPEIEEGLEGQTGEPGGEKEGKENE